MSWMCVCLLIRLRPPKSTRTDTPFPYTPRFLSVRTVLVLAITGNLHRLLAIVGRVELHLALYCQFEEQTDLGLEFLRKNRRRVVDRADRSEEHTSELQSLMRISYAIFCLQKKHNQYHSLMLNLNNNLY